MKLHPITWILLGAAGLQLVVLAGYFVGIAYAAGEAKRMPSIGPADIGFLQAWLARWLGDGLLRLGAIVASVAGAAWVEFLARTYHQLRALGAQGETTCPTL